MGNGADEEEHEEDEEADLREAGCGGGHAAEPEQGGEQAGIDGVESEAEAQSRAEATRADTRESADDSAQPAAALPPAAATTTMTQPWPPTLPEQVRAVAQLLGASPAPLALAAIEASFKGKGPWKKGLPRILETLEALGRAQRVDGDVGGGWRG